MQIRLVVLIGIYVISSSEIANVDIDYGMEVTFIAAEHRTQCSF
jgi:hypothetical protein